MNASTASRRQFLFVAATFAWSWTFFVTAFLVSIGIVHLPFGPSLFIVVGAFGPSITAFYLTSRHLGRGETFHLSKRGFSFGIPLSVCLLVVVVPMMIAAVGQFAGGTGEVHIEPTLPVAFVVVFFLGGSFGEEFGWRGFLLPVLLERHTGFSAAFIVAAIWSVWHLPLFWIGETSQYSTPFWLYAIYVSALSLQYTWVYLRTNGNLFACLLLHTFTNLTVIIFPLGRSDQQIYRFAVETSLNVFAAIVIMLSHKDAFFANSRNALLNHEQNS